MYNASAIDSARKGILNRENIVAINNTPIDNDSTILVLGENSIYQTIRDNPKLKGGTIKILRYGI